MPFVFEKYFELTKINEAVKYISVPFWFYPRETYILRDDIAKDIDLVENNSMWADRNVVDRISLYYDDVLGV